MHFVASGKNSFSFTDPGNPFVYKGVSSRSSSTSKIHLVIERSALRLLFSSVAIGGFFLLLLFWQILSTLIIAFYRRHSTALGVKPSHAYCSSVRRPLCRSLQLHVVMIVPILLQLHLVIHSSMNLEKWHRMCMCMHVDDGSLTTNL